MSLDANKKYAKRMARRRRQEERKWARRSGAVTTRQATPAERARFDEGRRRID